MTQNYLDVEYDTSPDTPPDEINPYLDIEYLAQAEKVRLNQQTQLHNAQLVTTVPHTGKKKPIKKMVPKLQLQLQLNINKS